MSFLLCILLFLHDPPVEGGPASLVAQLASPSFRVREEATRKLLELGGTAKAALEEGMKSADAEVRERCKRVHADILPMELAERLAKLAKDDENKLKHNLPGWERYSAIAGKGSEAKAFYAAALSYDLKLSVLLETDKAALARRFHERRTTMDEEFARIDDPTESSAVLRVSYDIYEAGFWFIAFSDPEARKPLARKRQDGTMWEFQSAQLCRLCKPLVPNFRLKRPGDRDLFGAAVAAWLDSYPDTYSDFSTFLELDTGWSFALQSGLSAVRPVAIRALAQPKRDVRLRVLALGALAMFGEPGDAPTARAWLGNMAVPPQSTIYAELTPIQVGDVALLACVRMEKLDPLAFGFEWAADEKLKVNPNHWGIVRTLGREKAFEMYADYLRK